MKRKSRVEVRRFADASHSSEMVAPPLFCIVSWHRNGRYLSFWDGMSFGVSAYVKFFKTRKEARVALKRMPRTTDKDFREPNVLDVEAYNVKFGRSLGPKPEVAIKAEGHLDRKTGILVT